MNIANANTDGASNRPFINLKSPLNLAGFMLGILKSITYRPDQSDHHLRFFLYQNTRARA